MNRPTVSVIVPNYNHGKYLRKRINSILEQTFNDFELIILDDASTDESEEIIASYAIGSAPIRFIPSNRNSGTPFRQWKKGIDLAKGKYVWFAESDDYNDKCFLEKLVPILDNNDTVGFVFANSYLIDQENEVHGNTMEWKEVISEKKFQLPYIGSGTEELPYLMQYCYISNSSASVIRLDALKQVDWEDVFKYRFRGDWLVYSTIATKWQVAYLPEILNYYRIDSGNAKLRNTELEDYREVLRNRFFAFKRIRNGKRAARGKLAEILAKELHANFKFRKNQIQKSLDTFLFSPLVFIHSIFLALKYRNSI